jgi:LuxR family transcriptional regulator, maltose regulon positive regulatory protein
MPTLRRSRLPNRQPTLGKLRPPRLGRVFGRDRLFEQLDASAAAPGLWVFGPPGIGKTTMVATYLSARAIPCLWLQLDASDADPASFVYFLREAAALVVPRRKLHLPLPGADDLRDVPAFIRRCFRRLALVIDLPWVLVLDNVQELGSAPMLHAGMAAALAELPERARVIAISREAPPGEYARALANQQLVTLDESALRFTDDDTQQLVNLHGREWQAAELRRLTDGWAAAMILLLATRTDLSPDDSLRSGTARDRLFAFFAGEVMEKLGPSDAAVLMRVAFLPSATADMAVTISGDPRAADLLAELVRRSLFTERREGTPETYTFHALFSEFLRVRAAEWLTPTALRDLQLRAAQLLAAHGHADAAIARLLEAAAWDEATELLLRHAAAFAAQGRTAMVRDWIMALPEAARANAQVVYWLGYSELATQPADALKHLEQAYASHASAGDSQAAFYAAAAAADAIVFLGAGLNTMERWMPVLRSQTPAYLASRSNAGGDETDLRVLPGLLAAFVYCDAAHPLTATLADLAERMLDRPLGTSQRILLGTLAYYLFWTGQLARLDRIIVKIDRVCAESDAAAATLLRWYGVGVLIRSLLGRVDEALDHARRALMLVSQGPPALRAKAHLAMVLAAIAARDAELARTQLAEASVLIDPDNATDATVYHYQRGLLMLLDGEWHNAAKLMRAAVATGRASGWPLREHIALLGLALAATEAGELEEAQATLLAAIAHPFNAVCVWHHWIGGLIAANLADRLGDQTACIAALTRAFAVAREFGYDFGPMPFCCGDMMSRLALIAIEHDIDAPIALAIARRYALPAPRGASERWPWPVRIRTLGRFSIERDGAPAAAARKESRKPLDLLKLLMALGGEGVPVARLCAALWPDAEGDAARNSFDNALHRLRKLLGGDVHLPLQNGGLSLNARTCWSDVAALDACFHEMDGRVASADTRADTRANTAELSAWADRALGLCQGDFLVGEEDLADVLVARERIRTRFARHMLVLGDRLEVAGQHAQAASIYGRVAEQQPLAEAVVRRHIACLLTLGQRAEAYEAFRRCRHQLSVVLGIRPAPETEALVASLRNL